MTTCSGNIDCLYCLIFLSSAKASRQLRAKLALFSIHPAPITTKLEEDLNATKSLWNTLPPNHSRTLWNILPSNHSGTICHQITVELCNQITLTPNHSRTLCHKITLEHCYQITLEHSATKSLSAHSMPSCEKRIGKNPIIIHQMSYIHGYFATN
jgi:hypothetical protein